MTTKTITIHWYDTKKDQYYLQYEKGNRHRPQTHTYVHKELTIIHWGFDFTGQRRIKKADMQAISFFLNDTCVSDNG